MANPSVIVSGSGTEVLRRSHIHDLSNTSYTLIDGVADHIYTVLSVTIQNRETSTVVDVGLYITTDTGTDIKLLDYLSLPGQGTFVFNDMIVLAGADELKAIVFQANNTDWYCSYIDQDFT